MKINSSQTNNMAGRNFKARGRVDKNRSKTNKIERDLASVLKECNKAANEGYCYAHSILEKMIYSQQDIANSIKNSIEEMKEYGVNDASMFELVKEQLMKVQTTFSESLKDTDYNLENKRKLSGEFNIVLFGKTMCGKSTFREILTNGDGSSIGKGGQRTTRDIIKYKWKGLTITDTPGVDAFDGAEDDRLAEEAAMYADLIIFFITNGQPESSEADWLVKLKGMDKPIICICNTKKSIADEFNRQRFLMYPERYMNEETIQELTEQFNEFIASNMPNEKVTFWVTHLQAKFESMHCKDSVLAEKLSQVSRFSFIENQICNEVIANGLIHKKRSFLSIVDKPCYEQYYNLLDFSTNTLTLSLNIFDKIKDFDTWKEDFNEPHRKWLVGVVEQQFDKLSNAIPGFVEDNIEREDISQLWNNKEKSYKIIENIEHAEHSLFQKVSNHINEMFKDLNEEIKFTSDLSTSQLDNYKFTNWRKRLEWSAAIIGAASGIAFLVSNPIGWALAGAGVIVSIFSFFCSSREKKLREARQRLTEKLNKHVNSNLYVTRKQANAWFFNNIKYGIEKTATDRLYLLKKTMLTLTNSQRMFAWENCASHKEISKNIFCLIMEELGFPKEETDKIVDVARIPGKKSLIVVRSFFSDECIKGLTRGQKTRADIRSAIQRKLGNKEFIDIIRFSGNMEKKNKFYILLKRFNLNVGTHSWVDDNAGLHSYTLCYIKPKDFSASDKDNLNLIQQLLNVHIIQR